MKLNFSGTAKKAPEIVGISDPSALNIEGTLEIPEGYTLVRDNEARATVRARLDSALTARYNVYFGGGLGSRRDDFMNSVRELRRDYGTVMVDEELAKLVGLRYIA